MAINFWSTLEPFSSRHRWPAAPRAPAAVSHGSLHSMGNVAGHARGEEDSAEAGESLNVTPAAIPVSLLPDAVRAPRSRLVRRSALSSESVRRAQPFLPYPARASRAPRWASMRYVCAQSDPHHITTAPYNRGYMEEASVRFR